MISVDGIVLPNRPLSNLEISDSFKKLHIPSLRGVFVRDALPRTPNKNECGILNLDDSSGMELTGFYGTESTTQIFTSTATVSNLLKNCNDT